MTNQCKNVFPFKPKAVCVAVLSGMLLSAPVLAADQADGANVDNTQAQLEDVVVKAKKRAGRRDNEVTGLGKVVKNSDTLDKEQVLNIRDLTRYDPGIAVVEQGRGASSGYSIRGVDKNRVGLNVDGLPQIQSYTVDRTSASSGARNEIEYENIQSIEINKGANSAEQGNGSLGGSVSFRTKEPNDVIKEGQNWGLDTKNTYSSKNRQWLHSIAAAGRLNGWEGLAIFTHRDGSETKVHRDAINHNTEIERQSGNVTPGNHSWFVLEGECPDPANCSAVRPLASSNLADTVKETVSADEYTGNQRVLHDPMDYKSRSWLLKGGYNLSDRHYIGGVFETSKQRYDIRDMTLEKYWPASYFKENKNISPSRFTKGVYLQGDSIFSAFAVPEGEFLASGMQYSRLRYFDERHRRTRKGLEYRYQNPDRDGVVDRLRLSFDRQDISLDSHRQRRHCSVYPTVDPNCRASLDKPWSLYESERSVYDEKHNVFQLSAAKKFDFSNTQHDVQLGLGFDRFKSTLQRKDFFIENAQSIPEFIDGNGTRTNPYRYRLPPVKIYRSQLCRYDGIAVGVIGCDPREIKGHNYYVSLRDNMSLGQYFDWGLGARYDYHKMTTDDSWTAQGTFKNFSWNSGLVFKPTRSLSFSHRISNGFRVPSFQELFGIRVDGFQKGRDDDAHYVGKFEPEKALNNEWGVHLRGDWGTLEASYFRNRYKNLIGQSTISIHAPGFARRERGIGYRNIHNISLDGINIIGKIDWNGVYDKVPEGFYSTVAYNRIKLKKAELTHDYFRTIYSPLLDAIQPSRYILGLGYDHPSGKWGVNSTMTYSKAKNPNELKGFYILGYRTYDESATDKATKSWYTFDLSGYVTLKDKFTLRAGIYNLANRRYSQWESVRQSAIGAVNRQTDVGSYARYAAPGRNVALSLEMKF
ncbi:lactoferrin/transferrin family TonB-dependent receptor [Neisseria zalophi]|uniref:Lactoferrin/transferrin family TonB-dependent receptor n=1 Tax=Neisseria zalophi TaxID=640030 RepID=A0A5J6PV04_9NEIS|nr:lactoferrin/transferrin family TonB-dependent receptor [Neisseria zalophi]